MNCVYRTWKFGLAFLFVAWVFSFPPAQAEIQRIQFTSGENRLTLELWDDDLVHVELLRAGATDPVQPVPTTEMVCTETLAPSICDTVYDGATEFVDHGDGRIETGDLRLVVDRENLMVSVFDKTKGDALLTTVRAGQLDRPNKVLVFTRTPELDVYGLGQQFVEPGEASIDWDGRVREGGAFGNIMAGFNGGANGNTQIPVMYAVNGASHENYALFLDNTYRHRWDFTSEAQWQVEMADGVPRFFLMTGEDLLDLRHDYMELVGRPPVPPRAMFGLWVSEYGYDDWAELEGKLASLRENRFPLDGFVLDLQWFGGIPDVTGRCRMGSLDFANDTFPDPASQIRDLEEDNGVRIMLIEEAYVCDDLPEHARLLSQGCLVRNTPAETDPAFLAGFWGDGGMIDYTSERCARQWHDDERQKLVDAGVVGHWTDLGEPEMFSDRAGYAGGDHDDVHNVFNLRWIRSIHEGYGDNGVVRRPFMMSRSGTAGLQRYGAAMWSGDIASRLTSLAAHAANQMHMSFSGVDYYGADIGGFHRNLEGDLDEMYTQWFAYGMLLDIPGRPHVENLCNCKETAPDRIGELESNRANARLRYSLIPYLYSLAHRAYRHGDPVMPPPVLHYQTDDNLRSVGHEKLIGRDLLVAITARHGETQRDVYLPAGGWYDWHTHQPIRSAGQSLADVPVRRDGLFQLPMYARAGALIPMMVVDEGTLNALGERQDGSRNDDLWVKAFVPLSDGADTREFTLYEDDGVSLAYQSGSVRTTRLTMAREEGNQVTVTIHGSEGTYAGAPAERDTLIQLVGPRVESMTLNGEPLTEHASLAAFNAASEGWLVRPDGTALAKSGSLPVGTAKNFRASVGAGCQSQFSVITVPGEGNGWNPSDPERALTCAQGRVWEGRLPMDREEYKFAADNAWAVNWGADGEQDGPNFPALDQAGTYQVRFDEDDPASPSVTLVDAEGGAIRFVCRNGHTEFGTSVYVVGNVPALGTWDPGSAVLLSPDGPYPTWTGTVDDLPTDQTIEWKCIKRLEGDDQRVIQWEPGANNVLQAGAPEQIGEF
jgi:alpha-glucosidase